MKDEKRQHEAMLSRGDVVAASNREGAASLEGEMGWGRFFKAKIGLTSEIRAITIVVGQVQQQKKPRSLNFDKPIKRGLTDKASQLEYLKRDNSGISGASGR